MQKTINIDLAKLESEVCECGWVYWKHMYIIKRIPAIMAGNSKDIFQAVEYFACDVCGKPHRGTPIAIPGNVGPKPVADKPEADPTSDLPCPV